VRCHPLRIASFRCCYTTCNCNVVQRSSDQRRSRSTCRSAKDFQSLRSAKGWHSTSRGASGHILVRATCGGRNYGERADVGVNEPSRRHTRYTKWIHPIAHIVHGSRSRGFARAQKPSDEEAPTTSAAGREVERDVAGILPQKSSIFPERLMLAEVVPVRGV